MPDTAERRIPIQLAEPHLARHPMLGNLPGGDDDGHERQRDEHRHRHERRLGGGIREHQQELSSAESHIKNHHVDGEQPSAVLAARPIVKPALRDHVNARQANARHQAHDAPDERIDQTALNQNRRRGNRSQRREYADVAEPAQQRRCNARAEQIPEVIARHDDAGHHRGEPFERRAHPEQRALQTRAQHQHTHA
jgi:hypothetical protein